VGQVIKLVQRLLPTLPPPVLVERIADAAECRGKTAGHVGLNSIMVSLEFINY